MYGNVRVGTYTSCKGVDGNVRVRYFSLSFPGMVARGVHTCIYDRTRAVHACKCDGQERHIHVSMIGQERQIDQYWNHLQIQQKHDGDDSVRRHFREHHLKKRRKALNIAIGNREAKKV